MRVVVIGSGAGGGVVAATLAEAGHEVVLLEEGQRVGRERMTQREEQMYPLLYRDGGQQYTADGGISVLQGRVLGGSTVVNMADVVRVPEGVLDHWRDHFGLSRHSTREWMDAAEVCEAAIGANQIPDADANRNAQILLDGGRKTGRSGGLFEHNRVGCVGSGYCSIGCAYDAKRSVALTWIPRAVTAGAEVRTEHRVERLLLEGSKVTGVVGHTIEPGTNAPIEPFEVKADHVVLCAGAVHSPLLLLRSGIKGQVGHNLSLQPQAPVTALFADEVRFYRGIPQAAYLDDAETATAGEGLAGYRLESISSTPGMSGATLMAWGPDALDFMKRFNDVAAVLVLAPDRPGGRVVEKGNGRPKIDYRFQAVWAEQLRQGIRAAAEVFFAAGAQTVGLPFAGVPMIGPDDLGLLDDCRIEPNRLPLISAHVQGTCRMGPDPASSVVDLRGFVHGVDNLQVLDASLFPTTASSHTMIPVMQAALLGARELA